MVKVAEKRLHDPIGGAKAQGDQAVSNRRFFESNPHRPPEPTTAEVESPEAADLKKKRRKPFAHFRPEKIVIYFDTDSHALRRESRSKLTQLAKTLHQYPHDHLELAAHTDCTASEPYNLRLSDRRAQSVLEYLIGNGVGADRVILKSYGESRPAASNATEAGRQQNRRVELKIRHVDHRHRQIDSRVALAVCVEYRGCRGFIPYPLISI